MEELFHLLGDMHVLGEVETADVGRGDDAVSRQLPDVELVHRQDTVNLITPSEVHFPGKLILSCIVTCAMSFC